MHSCGIPLSKSGYRYLQTALVFLMKHSDKTVWDACSFMVQKHNAKPLSARESMGTAIKVAYHQPFIEKMLMEYANNCADNPQTEKQLGRRLSALEDLAINYLSAGKYWLKHYRVSISKPENAQMMVEFDIIWSRKEEK